jgi:hypothetical protein
LSLNDFAKQELFASLEKRGKSKLKKIVSLILLFVCIAVSAFFFIKIKDRNHSLGLPLDKDGNYTGFCDLPTNYTFDEAKNAGYFVREDLHTIANENAWDNFVQASLRKENTSIRMVQYFTEDTSKVYYTDLFYRNGYYYKFDSTSKKHKIQPFLYLLSLGNIIVLTNDKTLTDVTVRKVMASSSREYAKKMAEKFSFVMYK